jgi:hypothetical protein
MVHFKTLIITDVSLQSVLVITDFNCNLTQLALNFKLVYEVYGKFNVSEETVTFNSGKLKTNGVKC